MRSKSFGPAGHSRNFVQILIALILFTLFHPALAVTLEWDANAESNLAGYKVYVGSQSRQYDTVIDVGLATQESLPALQAGQAYYFAVTAYDSDGLESEFSDEVTYTMTDLTTATPLADATACAGGLASFSTTVTGAGPFGFLWRKDGTVINGAATATLALANLSAADIGTYSVEVSGPGNSVTNSALLSVNELASATPLVNAMVCAGGSASFNTTVAGAGPFTFVWRKDGALINGATTAALTLTTVNAANAGAYSVEASGACNVVTNTAVLAVNELTTATPLASVTVCAGGVASFGTTVAGTGPFTFVWRKDGVLLSSRTSGSFGMRAVRASDAALYTLEVNGTCNTVTNTALLTVNELATATPLTNATVDAGQPAEFATLVTGTDSLFVWKKDGAVIDAATNAILSLAAVSAIDAGIYTVEVSGPCNTVTNSAVLTVNEETAATPLADAIVSPGEAALFATAVTGTGPFEFVWKKDGAVIAGATSAALVISEVSVTDAGTYTVEVSGTCNTVTSAALLAVNTPTTATPLAGAIVCAGSPATFATLAAGNGPFGFLWKKDGAVINGATDAVFTIPAVSATDTGLYTVEVSGPANTVTSTASLTLHELMMATPLTDATVYGGQPASFTTTVTGTGLFGFVWRKDGAVIDGATNAVFTIPTVNGTNAGTYAVEVSGACHVLTNTALLTVQLNETNALPVGLRVTVANAASPVAIAFPSEVGRQYIVQASADLRSWQTIYSVTSFTNGTNQWEDADAPNHPMRFYRVLGSQP